METARLVLIKSSHTLWGSKYKLLVDKTYIIDNKFASFQSQELEPRNRNILQVSCHFKDIKSDSMIT